MKIPKYWAKSTQVVKRPDGRTLRLGCWHGSDLSAADARQGADARLAEIVLKALSGAALDRYGYGERPIREEILQSVANRSGAEIAIVTRNLYGALVVNAARAMFIDVDLPPARGGGSLLRLFGAAPAPQPDEAARQRLTAWAGQHPEIGLRVYRTFAGLRCLITNETFEPGAADALDILRDLGSDPLYVRLCQAQNCFRARLTPKPWRCTQSAPPGRFPREGAALEERFQKWLERYERARAGYSVCTLLLQLGPAETHPDIEPILALHDQVTAVAQQRPLA